MKVQSVKRNGIIIGYLIESPKTGDLYCFYTKESGEKQYWKFNGNYNKPTFTPEMYNQETGERFYVTNGKVHYVSINGEDEIYNMIDM